MGFWGEEVNLLKYFRVIPQEKYLIILPSPWQSTSNKLTEKKKKIKGYFVSAKKADDGCLYSKSKETFNLG